MFIPRFSLPSFLLPSLSPPLLSHFYLLSLVLPCISSVSSFPSFCFPVSSLSFSFSLVLPYLLPFFLIFSCASLSPPFLSHFLLCFPISSLSSSFSLVLPYLPPFLPHFLLCFPISSLSFSFSLVLPYLLPFFLIFSCASLSPPFLSHFLLCFPISSLSFSFPLPSLANSLPPHPSTLLLIFSQPKIQTCVRMSMFITLSIRTQRQASQHTRHL